MAHQILGTFRLDHHHLSHSPNNMPPNAPPLGQTDASRWRLRVSDGGRHVWHYLRDDAECKAWPQSIEDKYWLGLPTELPQQPAAKTPLDAATNGLNFYRHLQSNDGHWAGEYGGPMFLLPGIIIGMYVTKTPIPEEWKIEVARYLWNRADKADGGWGIHIEGCSTVFGTALNYTVLRIVGVPADHPMMVKARGTLHKLGGAAGIPSWGKLWLAILNCYEWEGMNPIPPELWLLPDWLPIHPWRWWIHTRMVYIPMGYLWGRRFKAPLDPLIESLRQELYVQPYESINWPAQRGNIAQVDVFYPHTKTLKALMGLVGAYDNCHIPPLRRAGIKRAYELLVLEDENTSYQCLGPVNKMLNYIARWDVEGHDSHAMRMHREKLKDFMWIGAEGMMMTGTNGSQLWDTSFIAQAMVDSGLAAAAENRELTKKLLHWLDECQIRDNPRHHASCYRFATKGAWPFSTKEQGYVVSDCTGEGLKAVIMLQENLPYLGKPVSRERMHDAVDLLLTMQNPGGGFASYETINGPGLLELINPAEVFGDIMIEYAYPECTTSVVTALLKFTKIDDYRQHDIAKTVQSATQYILKAQRDDGSWFGSWAICFTYATMFAVESLSLAGNTYDNSDAVRRACDFLASKQMDDGGWGETYKVSTIVILRFRAEDAGELTLFFSFRGCCSRVKRACIRRQPSRRWCRRRGWSSRCCMPNTRTRSASRRRCASSWTASCPMARGPRSRSKASSTATVRTRKSPPFVKRVSVEADAPSLLLWGGTGAISYPNYKFSFTIWALGKAARELDWN